MNSYDIIKAPILTENSYAGIEGKRYSFKVDVHATKTQIKAAVQEIFKVSVKSVNTMTVSGKLKRMGKNQGYTADYKKAVVQLSKDSKPIAFFESLA